MCRKFDFKLRVRYSLCATIVRTPWPPRLFHHEMPHYICSNLHLSHFLSRSHLMVTLPTFKFPFSFKFFGTLSWHSSEWNLLHPLINISDLCPLALRQCPISFIIRTSHQIRVLIHRHAIFCATRSTARIQRRLSSSLFVYVGDIKYPCHRQRGGGGGGDAGRKRNEC